MELIDFSEKNISVVLRCYIATLEGATSIVTAVDGDIPGLSCTALKVLVEFGNMP